MRQVVILVEGQTEETLVNEAGLPAVLERCPTLTVWWEDLLA